MLSKKSKNYLAVITTLFSNLLILLTIWLIRKYDNVTIDQFLYQMKSSATGVDHSLGISASFWVVLLSILFTYLEVELYLYFKDQNRYRFIIKNIKTCIITILVFALTFFSSKLKLVTYAKTLVNESNFIAEHYVTPTNDIISFPKEKRNLIYIYLESMEASYANYINEDEEVINLIPELTKLAQDNISFSYDLGVGGMQSFNGTTWTAASMVSQTSGLTIKTPLFGNQYKGEEYLPGAITLGDILNEAGYKQVLLMGSDANFANRDTYFRNHGNYEILDTNSLKSAGRLDSDYHVWWGFEDNKLFNYAKEELLKLSKTDQPFNFTMLTADTHFPDGYVSIGCEDKYDSQYANVIAHSSKQVYEFVEWIKAQDFYENTTIVISGDHLTMDPNFFKDVEKDYKRSVYNAIINAPISPNKTKERLYGTFDMFPTTLASLNIEIKGDRLALGTNLFSEEKTLAEIYGVDNLNYELTNQAF